ncbi:stage III sporulation protein AE [Alicyclobacillus cycloheptanicus]|uniref:Stage III sporulation protein AE n=1 Tax=Alicyclobacillus cycloheptanicus TaxID=1457 RepID=A0ABT9XDI7_9BACL|nr:stage III sporulation protein AE [Alicyclobacillus cycloheptanicus]MDQ0188353.1 stage III sporulation protein AE [Alicyclobacillus cycloheptanicus]WDM01062.1 stage III sporulation protein AE [Alicyclobacillus cycloheptanicus]
MRRITPALVRKLGIAWAVFLLTLVVHATAAWADNAAAQPSNAASTPTVSVQQAANEQLDHLPIQSITRFWDALQQEYGGYLPDASGTSLVRDILDNGGINLHGMVQGVIQYLLDTLIDNARLLGGILVLSVLAAVLESLQGAFEQQTVSQVAYAMIFLVLMVLAIGSFTEAIGTARHAIQSMNDFMLATVPLMTGLLAASGAVASAAFFNPVVMVAVEVVSNLVFLVVFPLIFFSAVLDIASALSPRYQLTRLAGLLRSGGVAVLGLGLSAFLGVTAVLGAGRGIADGVSLRVIKFGVGTFVPVVGKAVADATETIASASLLVKNAVGIGGLVIVACLALFPALKILALSLIYNGGAALMQPLGDTPLIACLGALGKSLLLVFASVAAVALMFFIFICILLASANLAVVMG